MRVLIDGGYHKGVFTEAFCKKHPDVKVVLAFEPNRLLAKYAPTNELIHWFNKALGDVDGYTELHESHRLDGATICDWKKKLTGKKYKVPVMNIIDILREIPLEAEIHLKLDVEGAEFVILNKLINSNQLSRVHTLYVEWHVTRANSRKKRMSLYKSKDKILTRLGSHGIKVVTLK